MKENRGISSSASPHAVDILGMNTQKVQAAKRLAATLITEEDMLDFLTDHPNERRAINNLAAAIDCDSGELLEFALSQDTAED